MERFKRILVAVDLSGCSPLTANSLGSTAQTTMDTAVALAHASDAELLILTVFNWTEEALQQLDSKNPSEVKRTFKEEASLALDTLVGHARSQGVIADSKLVLGKPWIEIIRQVEEGQHDLVVVGPHELHGFRWLFMGLGNTDLKLLRQCPCPVLVCTSAMNNRYVNILVATDLGPVSESALHYGIMLGALLDAKVHLLHVARFPNDPLGNGQLGEVDAVTKHHHQEVLTTAEKTLREQLESMAYRELGENCQVHLAEDVGDPAHRIEQFIATNNIDLLVLGTAARHGLAGFIIGNMAERLLPEVTCSLFVVKGPEFHSTVQSSGESSPPAETVKICSQ